MKKILIIEDDQIVANVYRNKLAVEGYKAEVAFDGESGLKVLRVFQPDLIILDLMLPTISGVEVNRFCQNANHRFLQYLPDESHSGRVACGCE